MQFINFSESAKQQILQILERISGLKPVEKLLLYLRLPGEQPETGIFVFPIKKLFSLDFHFFRKRSFKATAESTGNAFRN